MASSTTKPAHPAAPAQAAGSVVGVGRRLVDWLLGASRSLLFGWVAGWGLCAAVAARAQGVGVSAAGPIDPLVGLAVGLSAVVATVSVATSARGRGAAGLAIAIGLGATALVALAGGAPGSWWLLAPFVAALGGILGLPWGLLRSSVAAMLAKAAVAATAAGGAALVWHPMVAAIGLSRAQVVVAMTMLVATWVGASGVAGVGWGHCRPVVRRLELLLLPLAVALLWWAVPASLWAGTGGVALAVFTALATAAVVAARAAASPWALLFALLAPWLVGIAARPAPVDGARQRLLLERGSVQAIYARGTQELQLWRDGLLIDGEGPDRPQSPFVATLLAALLAPGDRVLMLGLGAGRLPPKLDEVGSFVVDAVDFRGDALPLLERLVGDGPVPQEAAAVLSAAQRRTCRGVVPALAGLPTAARQAIVIAEPLHARSDWQVVVSLQAELRRVVGSGLVVQPFAMDRTPPEQLRRLLAAAAAVHPWNGVVAVGDCGMLVSCGAAPVWPGDGTFQDWPAAARWVAHSAHIGSGLDLQRAWLGIVAGHVAAECLDEPTAGVLPVAADDPIDRAAVLMVLRSRLDPPPIGLGMTQDSVLLGWVAMQSEQRAFAKQALAAAADAESCTTIQNAAARFLPMGAPTLLLQAALGLADSSGVRLRGAAAASLCAQAIDPTFFTGPRPALFESLPRPVDATGALEDLAALPAPARLVESCSGEAPLAVALRARFPSRCARALVDALAAGPLAPAAAQALREVADPFVLAEAGRALAARGGVRELLGVWRGDLPMPAALLALWSGAAADRRLLVEALAGRRDARALDLLALGLVDDDLALRRVAGASLAATVGERIAYDPEWPRSQLLGAAERVRALHNRAP